MEEPDGPPSSGYYGVEPGDAESMGEWNPDTDPFFHMSFGKLEERQSNWERERADFWREIRES
jgi:hypothetical protein